MDVGGYSAKGPRETNEDNFYLENPEDFSRVHSFTNGVISFILVSDGMGGYLGGDVASQLVVSAAKHYIDQLLDLAKGNQIELDAPYALTEIAQNAHEAILAESRARGNGSMGATFVGAFLSATHAWIGHVGDSRAYLVRDGVVTQITEDHSQVGRMLSKGLITEEEAQNHPARHRIERALGFGNATPDIDEIDLHPGDALLLCSDGVYTVLNTSAIADCLRRSSDAKSAAKRLVEMAVRSGTDDNSTAVLACNVNVNTSAAIKRRKPIPTTRVQTINPSRRERSTLRLPAYQQQGVSVRNRRVRSHRWLLPGVIVTVVLLFGVLVFFGIGQPERGVEENPYNTISQSSELVDTPSPLGGPQGNIELNPEFGPGFNSGSGDETQSPTTYANYRVGDEAILKYVDKDGLAHRFSENDGFAASDIFVVANSDVLASQNAQGYGYTNNSYQALDDSYRRDLLRDIAQYKSDPTTFSDELSDSYDSSLARIIAPNDYLTLLEALSQSDVSPESEVDFLVLNEDRLSLEETRLLEKAS